jgi:ABC-type branched-subunit amino acid transport system ATPase component
VLNRGEIVMHGASKELLQNPDLFSAYLKGY